MTEGGRAPAGASRLRGRPLVVALLMMACAPAARAAIDVSVPHVGRYDIVHNDSLPTALVRSVVTLAPTSRGPFGLLGTHRPEFYPDFLRTDVRAVTALYRTRGFLDVRVVTETQEVRRGTEDFVDITLRITEGQSTRVASVELAGVQAVPAGDLRRRLAVRAGAPFNEALIQVDHEAIRSVYVEHGYLLVTVAPEIDYTPGAVSVTYAVTEGPQMHFGAVAIDSTAERHTKDKLIRRHFAFHGGETFRSSAISQSERSLYDTGLFSDVRFSTLPRDSMDPTRVDLQLSLSERKGRYIEGGLTYDASSDLTVSGESGLTNVGGMNRRATGRASLGVGLARVLSNGRVISTGHTETAFTEPWVLGTRQQATAALFYDFKRDRQRYRLRTYSAGTSLDLRRELARLSSVSLLLRNAWVHSDTAAGTSADPQDYQDRAVNLSYDRDRRNDFFNPSRGHVLAAQLQYSGFGGTTNFARASVAVSAYHPVPLLRHVVVAARVNAGRIEPVTGRIPLVVNAQVYEVSRVDIPSRFRLGGSTTVRAYGEDEIGVENRFDPYIDENGITRYNPGGLALFLMNLELRWSTSRRWTLAGFIDAGNVWDVVEDIRVARILPQPGRTIEDADVRYGMGLGLRVATPLGPLRLDYAGKIGRPPVFDEKTQMVVPDPDGSRLQFAIGQPY